MWKIKTNDLITIRVLGLRDASKSTEIFSKGEFFWNMKLVFLCIYIFTKYSFYFIIQNSSKTYAVKYARSELISTDCALLCTYSWGSKSFTEGAKKD